MPKAWANVISQTGKGTVSTALSYKNAKKREYVQYAFFNNGIKQQTV
ncbi:hypothetical protein NBRC116188_26560 [Oceaniserpentilla sp. 4NH20-0058]